MHVRPILGIAAVTTSLLASAGASALQRPAYAAPAAVSISAHSGFQLKSELANWRLGSLGDGARSIVRDAGGDAGLGRGVHLTPVGVGGSPGEADPRTHTAYFVNSGANTVSVVNTATCSALVLAACAGPWPTVAVGNEPNDVAIDDATDTIYVPNVVDNTVSVIDGATCNAQHTSGCGLTPPTIKAGPGPSTIAFNPDTRTLYVPDLGPHGGNGKGNTVSVINAAICNAEDHAGCGQTPGTIRVGPGPFSVGINVANDTVYVNDTGNGTMSVIDGATCNATVRTGCHQRPPTVSVSSVPGAGLVFDATHDTVYVANGFNTLVYVVDVSKCNATVHSGCAQTPTAVPLVAAGYGITGAISIDTAGHTLYAPIQPCPCPGFPANAGRNTIAMLNTATCNGATTSGCLAHPLTALAGGYPITVTVDSPANTAYVSLDSGFLALLNTRGCNSVSTERCPTAPPTVATGEVPISVAVDQGTHTAYVTNDGDNTVSVVNTATCKAEDVSGCRAVAPTIAVGTTPDFLAVDEKTDTVYVPNFNDGTVSVIDGATCNASVHSGCDTKPPVVQVGGGPDGLAIDEATDTIYVASDGTAFPFVGHTVSVIDGSTCNATITSGCNQTPPEITLRGQNPGVPAVDEATDTVYVPMTGSSDQGDVVEVINGAICNAKVTSGCGQTPRSVTTGAGVTDAAVDVATDTVYVPNSDDGTVSVINGATCNGTVTSGCHQVPPTVTAGNGDSFVAIDPATERVYVSNGGYEAATLDFTVSVIDGASCNAVRTTGCGRSPGTVEVGEIPAGLAVNANTDTVYVTDIADNTVSVISG